MMAKLLSNFFTTEGLSWKIIVRICTDGAPAMLRFLKIAKKYNPSIVGIHSMIHRQALASKNLPDPLRVYLQTVINIVNFVKGSDLNTRIFRNLCKEMDAIHDSLLYYNQVRWLSRGNVMIRFHDLPGEIQYFLENRRKDVLLAKTKDDFFGLSLAYLSDIFKLLNELNRKMQGSDNNVITQYTY